MSTVGSGDAPTKGIVIRRHSTIATLRIPLGASIYQKAPALTTLSEGSPYFPHGCGRTMERFEVKRGLVKSMGGNAGLARLATEHFNDVEVNADGVFTASFAILESVKAEYTDDGKLLVDVVQMKGDNLSEFLSSDGGREKAMQSRSRWSNFLDKATGYSPKQRGDKAKEAGKKISKSKSAISMARKFMDISDSVTAEKKSQAEELMTEIQQKLDEGNGTRALSLSEKLNKLFN